MNDNAIAIASTLIKSSIEGNDYETAEDVVKAAMVAARDDSNTWLLTSDDDRFKAAVVAAHPLLKDDDRERLEKELAILKSLAAAISGVPVDFSALMPDDEKVDPIGLKKIWKETQP